VKLLPSSHLLRTGRVDHADWNYRPLLAPVTRQRFALTLDLLPFARAARLLEIGFGSGIFMPELALHCNELYGIDVHCQVDAVQDRLMRCGVKAELSQQDAASPTFADGFFDAIVAVSSIEFIDDIERAASEFMRILVPGGALITVMPGKSALLDLALRVATGESAERDYGDRRERVMPALLRHFRVDRVKRFFPIYTAYRLVKDVTQS
jgi:ubiquinone/menaquinone biosynthesis C-methylase UbiE